MTRAGRKFRIQRLLRGMELSIPLGDSHVIISTNHPTKEVYDENEAFILLDGT